MAIAVASISTGTYSSGNPAYSVAISKPSGLAVGDLMIAYINGKGNSYVAPSTVPTGFTLIRHQDYGFGTTNDVSTYYKIADSSDVAASTFTWGSTVTGGGTIGGSLLRITGALSTIDQSTSNNAGNTSSPAIGPLTPTYPNSLLLFGVCTHAISGSVAVGSYAIATDNPTWTEQVDTQSGVLAHAIASAVRPESTATGNWSASISGGGIYYVGLSTMIISAIVDATVTPDPVAVTITIPTPTVQQGQTVSASAVSVTITVPTPSVSKNPTWSNGAKTSAPTWVNEDKS